HAHAVDLVNQIVSLNKGDYFDEDLLNATPTDFCIGVAGYPEKHFEAPSYKSDLKYLKQKVDAGAEYVVTQLFFDNEKFKKFVTDCREMGINVPIIPGLKPISNKNQLLSLPKFFHIDLPDDLVDAIENCKNDDAVRQVGIEWSIQQSKDLIDFGVPCIHYYTMGKSISTREIVKAVY
ncbi:MAG: methylenetetrahydrofolate reductase, partial [Flavobacteriales bacterium]|nr:methylenetetrahydrofolate reductase [Flavobacteriales bacterium]